MHGDSRIARRNGDNGRLEASAKSAPNSSAPAVRVLHVAWLPPDSQGGYRTRVVEETRLLVELGHPVDLAVFAPIWMLDDGQIAERLQTELERRTGATVHVLYTSRFFDLTVSKPSEREIIQPLVRLAQERGVRIIHGQACYAARWAQQVAERVSGLKLVFDCHGISPEEELLTGSNEKRAAAMEGIERGLLSSTDLAVLVSQQMGRHFEAKYNLKVANQLLLPCCVDLAKFRHDAETRRRARSALCLREDQTVIGYAGTLAEWQWPKAMFRLFARIRERLASAHLLLFIPERDHARATSLLETERIPTDAYTLREVPNAEIGDVLAAADAGLLLRQDHPVNLVSSPTKFGEYLAAGVPVIATGAVGDFSQWIQDERTGVVIRVDDDDIPRESLDQVCTFLSEVRTDRQGWAERCRALAVDRLDWKRRIRELSQAYTSMADSAASGVLSCGTRGNGELAAATPCSVTRPVRLLFNGHDFKFARRFIEHFSRDPRYEVRLDEWPGHDARIPGQSEAMLDWADVIFCEWCLGNARWYSHHKRPGQKLFVRLHSQEMNLPYRFELAWENVDAIVFISFQHHERFCREQPDQAAKSTVIFNYTDCDALAEPKLPGACFNLGMVGINPQLKRPDLALDILAGLRRIDSRYTLSIKSRMPWEYTWLWNRPQEREYYLQFFERISAGPLCNAVVFDPFGDDMPEWYSKIGFILSTSDREGSHQAVAEGMAAGCVPIIRNWEGATPLYPAQFVFENVNQAVELILRCGQPDLYDRIRSEVKAYTRAHFDTGAILQQLEALLSGEHVDPASLPAVCLRVSHTDPRTVLVR